MKSRKASHGPQPVTEKKKKSSHGLEPSTDRIFIGVAGGSAAGKTTLCQSIQRMAHYKNFKVEIIPLDSFYKSIDKTIIDVTEYNFDHPLALDFDLAYDTLYKLLYSNDAVQIPQYSFVEHQRMKQTRKVYPANIILFEGLMAFYDKRIRNLMTYRIFINCDDDIRLCRRLMRDTTQRGRTIEGVLVQYNKFVKNAFRDFIYPTISYADLIIPGSRNNNVSVDFIVQNIKNIAKNRNAFKTAQQTKVFLFGKNQYYQTAVKKNYQSQIKLKKQPLLMFPTSYEHRKELNFFINLLLFELFTKEYFEEVYVYQFMKTIRTLLKDVFKLQNMNINDMELISIYQVREKLIKNSGKPIKIIFAPIIFQKQEQFIQQVKPLLRQKQTVIIVNIFCDPSIPNKINESEIEGIVFVNLFLVPNKKRLLDLLCSHDLSVSKSKEDSNRPRDFLLSNNSLTEKAILFIAKEFNIQYHKMDWKLLNQLLKEHTEKLKQKKEELFTYPLTDNSDEDKLIWVDQSKKKQIQQIWVLPQSHPILSGFYALHYIKEYPNLQSMRSKQKFTENYMEFCYIIDKKRQSLSSQQKQLFEPLEGTDISYVIHDNQLFNNKEIAEFIFPQNFILNNKNQNSLGNLWKSLAKLKNCHINQLFLVINVLSHYFILRLHGFDPSKDQRKIQFMDSINTPIKQIMSGTCSFPNATQKNRKCIWNMKIFIQTIMQLYHTEISVSALLARRTINQMLNSYYLSKQKNQLKKWLQNEVVSPNDNSNLLVQLEGVTDQQLGEEYVIKLKKWFDEQFVQQNIEKNGNNHLSIKRKKQEQI